MGFNSLQYFNFFVITLIIVWSLNRVAKIRLLFLLLASYYFYISHNHWLICLILISTQIDFFTGLLLSKTNRPIHRKFILSVSIVANLGILFIFKYFNFFGSSFSFLANAIGYELSWVDKNIVLPVGISFYTFQSMSYSIDVYRKEIPAEKSWTHFSLYVAYFPQLVAGPIVRAKTLLPQLKSVTPINVEMFDNGLFLIFRGLFKKMVLANYLALYADPFFADPTESGILSAWLGVYSFAFQIYFDFSGYTDIALGCAKLMGHQLPENFCRPYMATSLRDFWRRWHISLSTWLRDYLYRALGGNRFGRFITSRNLMITMLLGGLWHGAAWTFVLWGLWHGLLLMLERGQKKELVSAQSNPGEQKNYFVRILITFHLVCFSWILFRSGDIGIVWQVLRALLMAPIESEFTLGMLLALMMILGGFLMQYISEKRDYFKFFLSLPVFIKTPIYVCVTVVVAMFSQINNQVFIYFAF